MADAGTPTTQGPAPDPAALRAKFAEGLSLHREGKLADAARLYSEILSQRSNDFDALHMLGVLAIQTQRIDRAIELLRKAISLNTQVPAAHNNLGYALMQTHQFADPLASYDRAIALKPDYADAHNNRGNALRTLKRSSEALASYDQATALNPGHAEAHGNRSNALLDLKRVTEALEGYGRTIALKPQFAEAYRNRASALASIKRHEEAIADFDRALALRPGYVGVAGDRLYAKLHLCDWNGYDEACTRVTAGVRNGRADIAPFSFLAVSTSPDDQLRCARAWVSGHCPPSSAPVWRGEPYDHDRIRVAYVSADFRQHPMSVLIAGMFERHDRSRFDVTAISLGVDDRSELRGRVQNAVEHFIDPRASSDHEIAGSIRQREIDISVDLMGFTTDSRPNIFARRPAPVLAHYLGFPGTLGASYIDYVIADHVVAPTSEIGSYSERIVFLPDSYYVNDATRSATKRTFTRAELGLPAEGFLFCCFNNAYKIAPDIFDGWRILSRVEGSVLWLFAEGATAANNLRRAAAARGIDPTRLIFADRMPLSDHLARYRLAGLFLDTLPCNAHTTACDAPWMGVPVLTRAGQTFASRIGASLLEAIGVPELIADTPETYETLAVTLATNSDRLAAIGQRILRGRDESSLFDIGLFTRRVEAAYIKMHERRRAGLAPDHIVIPP
jgi:predicted O-linked N-acetylglucosamine transferase (SPINDLY family)